MAEKLASYLKRRAGEHLRVVANYDGEGYDIEYVREDLDREAVREQKDEIYEGVKAGLGPKGIREEVGERYVTLQVREETVIINLPWGQKEGSFVTLDPEAARQLTGFLNECMEHGYQDSIDL